MSQSIKFRGKTITYTSEGQLKKKLNLTQAQTKGLLKDYEKGNFQRYFNKAGDIGRYDLREKPLFFQEFGRKTITNKQLIGDKRIPQFKVFKKFPVNVKAKLTINLLVGLTFSPPNEEERDFSVEVNEKSENLTTAFFKDLVKDFYVPLPDDDIRIIKVDIISVFSGDKFTLTDMELRLSNPLCIGELYNEVIPNKNGNCVYDYIHKIFPRLSKKKKMNLKTTNDLYQYAIDNQLKMVAYDIQGNIIKSHYPETKAKKKNLIFIAFNNHLYPLKNQVLNKVKRPENYETHFIEGFEGKDSDILFLDPLEEKLVSFLEEGILPNWVSIHKSKVSSFFVDNIKYIYNPDYEVCKMVLSKLGLLDHLKSGLKVRQLGPIIEKLYLKKNIDSFMPNAKEFIRGGFNFQSDSEIDDAGNFIGLDKNLHYTYSLMKLPYLIKCNYLTAKRRSRNINHIVAHYLYNIELEESNILTMNNNIYSGEQLIYYMKEGIPFTIKEEIETTKTENYYKNMIEDLNSKFEKNIVKEIMVCLIGKFERQREMYKLQNFVKICSKDEADTFTGFKREIKIQNKKWWVKDSDKYYICSEESENQFDLVSRMPIAIQIKDYSRVVIYEMCKELGLNEGDILGIKTDCIYLHKKYENLFQKHLGKGIGDWKTQEYNKFGVSVPLKRKVNIKMKNRFDNFLGNQYAGGGKTWTIINKIIPQLNNYIVVSPSHASLIEYRLGGHNCQVIQYYLIKNLIPCEKNIIIDEVGMLDFQMWQLLYKCSLLGKRIIAFGDFKQLLPVKGDKENSGSVFMKYFFKTISSDWINRRNEFTKKYYDSIIYGKGEYALKEAVRHSKKNPFEAEVVIVHRNQTRKKYNELLCKKHGIKEMTDIGARIMCKTNDLKKFNIYNNYDFVVKECEDSKTISLLHEKIGLIKIPTELIKDNFDFSYARTIYNLQGATIGSYYFSPEDYEYINPRMAYTIISRLRGKGNRENKPSALLNEYLTEMKEKDKWEPYNNMLVGKK